MSAEKYPYIFSREMETIVYIYDVRILDIGLELACN